jgi:hypothetical protein
MRVSGIAGFAERARAKTANTGVKAPKLRNRAGVSAVLGTAPKPAADASRRPLTMFLTGRAKDHSPKSHSHDVRPVRWNMLPGGAGPGDEAMTNNCHPQVDAGRALLTSGSPHVKALSNSEWPKAEQFATADVIMRYQHPKYLPEANSWQKIEAFLNRGGGPVLSHHVLWNASPPLTDLLGLASGKDNQYKHKDITPKLPVTRHPILRHQSPHIPSML